MFVRKKKSANNSTVIVQIVENKYVDKKTKQRVLRHVGTARTDAELEELLKLGSVLKLQLESQQSTRKSSTTYGSQLGTLRSPRSAKVDLTQISEVKRCILGIHDVYGLIYDQLGFSRLFSRPISRTKVVRLLRDVVLARIACPASKRATVEMLNNQFDVSINLDHIYQMMSKMDDAFYEKLQQQVLSETLKLTGQSLNVLFYDATTLYFESFTEDELKQNGYSKDMKFNQPQVLLTLFVTDKGLPVGYEVFPGSTFEGHTLVPTLEKLKARYDLEDVVFVADRGLLSKENLAALEENNIKYILGSRLKNLPKSTKEAIVDRSHYELVSTESDQEIATFTMTEKQSLVVHYDPVRARKDRHDREVSIRKLLSKLSKSQSPTSLLNNYGYKKYISMDGQAKLNINQEKIQQEEQWDGLLGVITNCDTANPLSILNHYRGLWQVEESFRISKHDLKMRPIYHWKPDRVKAHIAICFMAFTCIRHVEYIMSLKSTKVSPESIRKALLQVQGSIILDESSGKQYLLKSQISQDAKRIYKALGIKIPSQKTQLISGA